MGVSQALLDAEATEEAKPDCPRCDGTGNSRWARVLYALWYRHLHPEVYRLCYASAEAIPKALDDWAWGILESGWGWHSQLDQGDVDALVAEDRLWSFTHTRRDGWEERDGRHPTAAAINAADARYPIHDDINKWVCTKHRLARWDIGDTCGDCRGTGKIGGIPFREWPQDDE